MHILPAGQTSLSITSALTYLPKYCDKHDCPQRIVPCFATSPNLRPHLQKWRASLYTSVRKCPTKQKCPRHSSDPRKPNVHFHHDKRNGKSSVRVWTTTASTVTRFSCAHIAACVTASVASLVSDFGFSAGGRLWEHRRRAP